MVIKASRLPRPSFVPKDTLLRSLRHFGHVAVFARAAVRRLWSGTDAVSCDVGRAGGRQTLFEVSTLFRGRSSDPDGGRGRNQCGKRHDAEISEMRGRLGAQLPCRLRRNVSRGGDCSTWNNLPLPIFPPGECSTWNIGSSVESARTLSTSIHAYWLRPLKAKSFPPMPPFCPFFAWLLHCLRTRPVSVICLCRQSLDLIAFHSCAEFSTTK